jgi:hypothetical protein
MLINSFLGTEKMEEEKSVVIEKEKIYSSYINQDMSSSEKIELEKRRRNQVYLSLDYNLSVLSYFDFFSYDTFQIIKVAKQIASISKKKIVTSKILLLAFLSMELPLSEMIYDQGMEKGILGSYSIWDMDEFDFKKDFSFFEKLKGIFFSLNKEKVEISYSSEVNLIFKKAAENALERFRTPVITSEILFLTILEIEGDSPRETLKYRFGNELDLYLLKYKLVKHIHKQESMIRENVIKNQQYFGYLLKTQLKDEEFEVLLKNNLVGTGVSLFRNNVILQALESNIFDTLKKDIHKSIRITNQRKYS